VTASSARAAPFARLFDGLPEGAWVGEIARDHTGAGRVLAANPAIRRLLGYDQAAAAADVQPLAIERFADPAAREALLGRLAADGAVSDHLLRLRRLDGGALWVELTARAQPVRRGAALHVEALVRDVSQRRRLDDHSRELYLQLLQAEKMAALGQTISGVAHELNNPLATILTWAERLAERQLDETARRGVDVILAETERAARIGLAPRACRHGRGP
jgi:PAS domain S-box-containing protein